MKLEWDLWIREQYCISAHVLILMVYCRYVGKCPFSEKQTDDLGAMGSHVCILLSNGLEYHQKNL